VGVIEGSFAVTGEPEVIIGGGEEAESDEVVIGMGAGD
jgi:hypothetical protein